MKKIKLLLPLWLVLLYFGSIVFMFQSRTENIVRYQQLVEEARTYAGNDVVIDAISAYEEALSVSPNVDIAVEAGDVYLEHEAYSEAGKWYKNQIHANFSDQKETYEYGIRMYLAQDNYRQAFAVYDECRDRELDSDKIEALMAPVMYTFDLSGQYEDCRPYGNLSGIAAVSHKGNWGYIDTEGNRVLDYIYLSAGMFSDMGAVVDMDGRAYFIDISGNKKITDKSILDSDPDIGKIQRFLGIEGGVLWAYNGTVWNCYDAQTYKRLFGGYSDVTNIANGIGAVKNKEEKWALLSSDGTLLTDFIYDEALTDQKDVFCRTEAVLVKEGANCLLLDKKGKQIGENSFEDGCAFYDTTYAAVKKDGSWTFVDQDGKLQDFGAYDQAESFSGGLAAVCKKGKWGYIDLQGQLVIDYQFDEAGPFCTSGVAFVKPEGEENWRLLTLYKDNHK